MKAIKVIIFSIITFFILTQPGDVFASGAPIETVDWQHDFNSRGIIDADYSTIKWERSVVTLDQEENGQYRYSGVLWTKDIRFRQDIYSLVLRGNYFQPSGTNIIGFVSFEGDIREYPLVWGATLNPQNQVRKLRLKIFFATSNPEVSPNLYTLGLTVKLQDRSEQGLVRRDKDRVSDLKKIDQLLQKYARDFGRYPIVMVDQSDKKNQWRLLENTLTSVSNNYRQNYDRGFRSQLTNVSDEYKYGYLTDSSGSNFLIWTQLEDIESEKFQESWNGSLLAVDCSPPTYCLTSKSDTILEPIIRYFDQARDRLFSQIMEGDFIRQENDSRVYLTIGGRRVWLRTPEIFSSAGGLWDNIRTFSSKLEVPLLKFIKKANDPSVYLVSPNGFKRSMLNEQILSSYGHLSEVVTVAAEIIDLLPDNQLIRAWGDTRVYFLDQNIKRWITTPDVLERLGFSFSEVIEVDPQELDYYSAGNPLF
ncbi:hypothetical protein IID20_02180 [Patescibacteria group bacterium]|nr:hypothetical protein [Patescibacteria group bacterium]